jgi:hypothetical protein
LLALAPLAAAAPSPAASDGVVQPGPPPGLVGTAPPPPDNPIEPDDLIPIEGSDPAEAPVAAAMTAAARQAHATGKPVPVDAATTETEQLVARPAGGFQVTANAKPVRARVRGSWVPVDLTLHRTAAGTLVPAATAGGSVAFSGGGDRPLVTTSSGRASLAASWPSRLPAPVLDGPTATYREVLPGVDLTVAATVTGGFSEVVVIKTAAAARNPALAALRLATRTTGGTLGATVDGGLRLTPEHGAAGALSASPPRMWDSRTAPGAASRAAAGAVIGADPSTADQPGLAARIAQVRVATAPGVLRLVPDHAALTDPHTVFPVYLDPTLNWHLTNAPAPAFDEVKQGSPCNHVSLYNNTGAAGDSGRLGVGVNHWDSCVGIEHAYYQWNLPHAIWGATINTATASATEVYTANCAATSTINLHWTGAINSATNWNNKPGSVANGLNVAHSFGPAKGSNCPNNDFQSVGFNVRPAIVKDAASHAGQFTVVLTQDAAESNGDPGLGFKRFTDNPSLVIGFDRAPAVPNATQLSATTGANNAGCVVSGTYPFVGRTIREVTTTMNARVSDPDGDHVRATFKYWAEGTTTTGTRLSADGIVSGGTAKADLPPDFITGLGNGKTVDWQVQVTDGLTTSGWSPICHFIGQPNAPLQPTVVSADGLYPNSDDPATDDARGAVAGTTGHFTLTNSGTPATKFVWALDLQPATVNPIPAQTVAAPNGTASLPVTPLTPGQHTLWVAAIDAAGDASSMTVYRFNADLHTVHDCSSLAACYDNTAITADGVPAQGTADGSRSYSATDLTNAGWPSGGQITVDGGAFTLPAYGSGQKDNVLAAGQRVAFSQPVPAAGTTALTFLAASSSVNTASPGAVAGNATTPYVAEHAGVTATPCFDSDQPDRFCPAQGKINFADGTNQTYDLIVPDWTTGSSYLSAMWLPHTNTASGQISTSHPRVYQLAVPIRADEAGKAITSVVLPDVGSGVGAKVPALHIFALGTRNTTAVGGAPAGQRWTGAWQSPTTGVYNYEAGTPYQNMTFRTALVPTVAGATVRIKLENPQGRAPLPIGRVTIAAGAGTRTPVPAGAFSTLTFGGTQSVTVPAGGMVYSNPLPFPVTPDQPVLVSFTLTGAAQQWIPEHPWANAAIQFVTAVGAGDHATDTTADAFVAPDAKWGAFTDILAGLDVVTAANPTVAVLGDGLIDAAQPNASPATGGARLADVVAAAGPAASTHYGTVAAGIAANHLMADWPQTVNGGTAWGGAAALSRIDRDVLSTPGLRSVIVHTGLDDVLDGRGATDLESNGFTQLLSYLRANNVDVIVVGLTPCLGYAGDGTTGPSGNDPCTAAVEENRSTVNGFLSGGPLGMNPASTPALYYVDPDAAIGVTDASGQISLDPDAAQVDKVNLSEAGYAALATAYLGPLDSWLLNDGAGNPTPAPTSAADSASNTNNPSLLPATTGQNPATLSAGATWITDPTRGATLQTDGITGGASTDGPILPTTGDYSVSAWVDPASTTGTGTVAAQNGSAVPAFRLRLAGGSWEFATPAGTARASTPAAANTWTHLVATFTARTHTMNLYVNGAITGTASNPTPAAAAGSFDLGHAGPNDFYHGGLSAVAAWNYPLTPTQVAALFRQVQ